MMPGLHLPATPSFSSSQLALSPEVHLVWPPVASCSQLTVVEVQIGCSVCAPGCKQTLIELRDDRRFSDSKGCNYASDSTCSSSSEASAAGSVVAITSSGGVVACGQVDLCALQHCGVRQTSSRLRVKGEDMGMLSLLLTDSEGRPPQHFLPQSAPLPVMPDMACQELQELMWTMVIETLENSDQHAYDPSIFNTPFHLLSQKLQNAMRWAWSTHFKPLALDLQYCLECMPDMQTSGQDSTEIQDYHAVLIPLVAFLRDHECCATLGALLSRCVQNGLELTTGGTSMPGSPTSLPGSPVWSMGTCRPDSFATSPLTDWDRFCSSTDTQTCDLLDSGRADTEAVMYQTQLIESPGRETPPPVNRMPNVLLVASLLLHIGLSLVTMHTSTQPYHKTQQAENCNASNNCSKAASKPLQWPLVTSASALLLAVAHLFIPLLPAGLMSCWFPHLRLKKLAYVDLAAVTLCLPIAALLAWGLGWVSWPVTCTTTISLSVTIWLMRALL